MFQHAMDYAFHDINHIVKPYLDDLPTHSKHQDDDPLHLRAIFICCRHYKIQLNPQKIVFLLVLVKSIVFFISKKVIRFDPLKVQEIVCFPAPPSLVQLQRLQG